MDMQFHLCIPSIIFNLVIFHCKFVKMEIKYPFLITYLLFLWHKDNSLESSGKL